MSDSKSTICPCRLLFSRRLYTLALLWLLLAGAARAQDFSISTLTPNNAVVVDVNALVGDDRGGIAVSGSQVFLTGDAATARFNRDTLGGGTSLGVVRDGLVANLATSTVYLLGNASSNALASGGGTFATLLELNGSTGVPSGNVIALSTPITLTGSSSSVGIFSGWSRIVVHNGTRVYRISLPSGTVTDLGAMATPARTASESWAYWGVAENVGSDTYIVYVRNSTTISRTKVPSGPTTTVATFANLNDMASFTVSVAQNRWYFHHESSSQFGAFSESLGYADATFVSAPVAPTIAVQPVGVSIYVGESASFSATANGTGPLAYQWQKNGLAITDATNTTHAIAVAALADAGNYSLVVTNVSGSITSSVAVLAVSAVDADLFKIIRLTASNAVVMDPLNYAGDDRGGLVATDQKIYLRGDDSVGSFNLNSLSGGIRLGTNFGALTNFFFYDSLVSDLRSQKAYVLGGGGTNILGIFGGTVSNLVELHGSNGVPTGTTITLSSPIVMPGTGLYNANVGIFSGWGRIVLHNGTRAYSINTASGTVTDLGAMAFPTHVNSESWASWGVAEYFGGSHYMVYARDAQSIVRTRIPDGATTVISTFSNLADLANFTVVPGLNRWYFHNETVNQFTNYINFGAEILGYADAAFLYQAPQATIVSQPQSLTVTVGASATFSVSATAVAALSYQWKTNGVALAGATSSSVTFANAQLTDSGLVFSVTVKDGGDPIDSANATLTVLPNAAPTLTVPGPVTVLEDAGSQTNLVTGISAGATHETNQTLTVTATSDNPALTGPLSVSYTNGTATLRYTNTANAFGSALITVIVTDNGGTLSGGVDSATNSFLLTVTPVNDAPSATRLTNNVVVLEDVGSTGVAGFLSAISVGPGEAQVLSVSVANNNSALFLVQPALNLVNGDLTFTPAPNAFGSATVTYILSDDGGTANGGVDASTNTFTLTVTGVNDAPTLALGVTAVNVLTNAGAFTTNIAPVATVGPASETNSQTVVGYVASNDNNALFSVQPTLGLNGNLNFTVAGTNTGTAVVSVQAQDSGDNLNGGTNRSAVATVTITVSGPNQAPTFTLATNNVVVAEDSGAASVSSFLTSLTAVELGQSVTNLTVSNNNSNLFSAQPVFTGSGATRTLTFTPAADANGSATVTVSATDDGSSPATGTQTFTITVTPVNDAPSFALPAGTIAPAGATWTARDSDRRWYSIASSADGSKLVAVLDGDRIYTSTDSGVTWTARESSRSWYSVASSADGSKLVAGVSGGQIFTSPDAGVTWTARDSIRFWRSVASSADGSKLVAGVDGGQIYTSPDAGVTWTARDSNRSWRSVASSADGSKLAAVEYGGQIYTSTDAGVTWAARDSTRNWSAVASSADGSKLVAGVYYGQIYTSVGTAGPYTVTVSEDSGAYSTNNLATNIFAGATNESAQVVSFTVTNDNNALFGSQPAISTAGTLSFTPAANAFGSAVVTVIAVDNAGAPGVSNSAAQTFTITINNLNDAPAIVFATNSVVVLEDAGAQSSAAFLSLSPGPFSEPGTVSLTSVANNNNGLFLVQPAIDVSGNLTFTPAADSNGVATVTVIAQDNTGLFSTNSFTLTVLPVNDAPSLTVTNLVINVLTNSGGFSGTLGATITYGPANETDQAPASFLITNNNNGLFTTQPSANESGNLSFSVAPGQQGAATLYVRVQDTGGTANGGVDVSAPPVLVTVNVTPGNSAPSFTLATNALTVLEDSGSFSSGGFLTALSPGAQLFEAGQIVTVTTANNNSNLFSGQPIISGGTLTFTPAANAFGTATVTVTATDNGTPALSSSQTVTITVTAVNDQPSFALPGGTTGPAGATWAARESNRYWYAVASSADGSKLVAVNPPAGKIYTSTDSGASWTARADDRYWFSVASSSDGTKLVAVVNSGQIYTSTDSGVSWTPRESVRSWSSVASSADGSKLVASTGGGQIYTSTDSGITWTAPVGGVLPAGAALASSADGTKLVGVIFNGQIYTSADSGASWTARESNRTWGGVASSADGSKLVAVVNSGGQIYTSTDSGVSWTARESSRNWYAVASSADGSILVAGDYGGRLYTSTDSGVTWMASESSRLWTALASSSDGSKFVAAVIDGQLYTSVGAPIPHNISVAEDSGAYSGASFATSILAGPANESAQTVAFITSNTASNLFAAQPSIVGSGASRSLSFTPAANANGSATVTVYAQDNGGTSPGVDTTAVQTFTITITPVNDPPTVTLATNLVAVLEDSGAFSGGGFATFTLPAGETGSVTNVLISNNNSNLFAVQPSVSLGGALTFTPAANANGSAVVTVQAQDDGGGQNLSAPQTFTITVTAVNDAPVFALSTTVVPLLEDAGAQTVAGFATNILGGLPADEAAQNVTFLVSNGSSNKFTQLPALNGLGALTFTLAPNANGVITVAVVAQDNGGTLNGGVDTSIPQFFTIVVTPVNDAPSVSYATNNLVVLEDSGPVGFPGFATFFLPADEAGQTVTNVATANNNNALFAVQPSFDLGGTLTFTPAANVFGSAVVSVTAMDNGGTLNGGANTSVATTFTITVTAVNDAPSFDVAVNPVGVLEDSGAATVLNAVTNISAGPGGESQSVAFITSNSASNLFTSIGQPVIGAGGTLTFTPAANANGSVVVTILAQDTGGTDNGGINTSAPQTLTILITNINDAPLVTFATNNLVRFEDSGAASLAAFATFSAPADELAQVLLGYTVSNSSNSLFSVQPSLALDGTLTFVPAANAFGVATITVIAQDDGGTANGGVDRSTNTFTLTLTGVNDAPTLAFPFSYVYVETNSGGFHTNLTPITTTGPANESGQFIQDFITTNNQPSFFTVQPYLLPNGDLDFTLANGVSGIVTLTVRAHDSGGTANGGVDLSAPVTFTIFVGVFNVSPTFTFGTNNVVVNEDAGAQTLAGQVANISSGDPGEIGQTVSFTTGNNNNPLFSLQPSIAANGTLTFTPATDAFGSATVTVIATDSGLPALSTTNTFTITVTSVNDAPGFALAVGAGGGGGSGTVTTLAGSATFNGSVDGTGSAARFGYPAGVAVDSAGNIYVGDGDNNLIRKITPAGVVTTLAGTAGPAGSVDGTGAAARFSNPNGVAVDSAGNVYVADTFNHTIRKITPAGVVTTVAGTAGTQGSTDGTGIAAQFNNPRGVAVDAAGNLYVTDTSNQLIRMITPAGVVTTLAGSVGATANVDGTGSAARFQNPWGIAVDSAGNLYVGGFYNQTIRKVTPAGVVTTLAGTADTTGSADGIIGVAQFNYPSGVAVDTAGNVYVTDTFNHTIRQVTPAGVVTTVAGLAGVSGSADGTSAARFRNPYGIAVDSTGNLYVADYSNHTIRKITGVASAVPAGITVNEDSGAFTLALTVTNILAGPANESGQVLSFIVTNNNPARFDVQPAIDASGTLTFTPGTNRAGSAVVTVYLQDNGGILNGGVDTAGPLTFTITLTPVNDPPTITFATNDVVVLEDSGAFSGSLATFATPPSNEGGQSITNVVTSNNNSNLFSVQPSVSTAGVLTFTPAANSNGVATVTVIAQDSGGTDNGGVNLATNTFTITVTAVNDAPSFALRSSTTMSTNTVFVGFYRVGDGPSWPSAPPTYTGQEAAALLFGGAAADYSISISDNQVDPGTITHTAWMDGYGDTRYFSTPAPENYKTLATYLPGAFSAYVSDHGGTTKTNYVWRQTVTTTVVTPDVAVGEDSGLTTVSNQVASLSAGPANESSQIVSFVVTNNNNALFLTQPAIDTNGTLTFTPVPNANGSATVTVYAQDNGGILNGGVDTAGPQTFTITVTPVNDAPSAVFASNPLEVMKNSAPTNIAGFATFSKGPADESSQSITNVIVSNNNTALFDLGGEPTIDTSGLLVFKPAPGVVGEATVTVTTMDNGGTASGGQNTGVNTFVIRVVSANIYVESTAAVAAGNSITVPVSILADGDENGVGFTLTFNPALLTFTGITAESGLTLVSNSAQAGSGLLGVVLSKPTDNTFSAGYNPMVYVTFTVATSAPATNTTVGFSSAVAYKQVTDKNANNIPYVAYTPNVVTITALATGLEGDVTPRPTGNGSVTVSDAVQIGRFAAGLDTITTFGAGSEFQRADAAPLGTQGDGRVTVADWVQTLRFAAGLDTPGAAGGPTVQAVGLRSTALAAGNRTVRIVGSNLVAGRANTVSIQLDSQGNEAGLSLSLAFDATALTFVSATTGSGASGGSLMVNSVKAAAGKIGLVLVLPAGSSIAAGTRDIVTLTFNVTGSGATTISVTGDSPVAREVADVNANVLGASFVGGSFNIILPVGLKAAGMERAADGSLRLVVRNSDGTPITFAQAAKYEVQVTSNLGGAWTVLPNALVLENGALKIVDPAANGAGLRLYKLVETP